MLWALEYRGPQYERRDRIAYAFGPRPFHLREAAEVLGASVGSVRCWLSKHEPMLVQRVGHGVYVVRA